MGPPALPRLFLAVLPLLNSCLASMRSSSRSSSHCGVRVDPLDPQPCVWVHVRTVRLFATPTCHSLVCVRALSAACPSLLRAHFALQPLHAWENHARYSCTAARDIEVCDVCVCVRERDHVFIFPASAQRVKPPPPHAHTHARTQHTHTHARICFLCGFACVRALCLTCS